MEMFTKNYLINLGLLHNFSVEFCSIKGGESCVNVSENDKAEPSFMLTDCNDTLENNIGYCCEFILDIAKTRKENAKHIITNGVCSCGASTYVCPDCKVPQCSTYKPANDYYSKDLCPRCHNKQKEIYSY